MKGIQKRFLGQLALALRSEKTRAGVLREFLAIFCSLIVGALIPPLIQSFINFNGDQQRDAYQAIYLGTVVAIGVFLIALILYLNLLVYALLKSRTYDIDLSQDIYVRDKIKHIAFSACSDAALRATHSIVVIGPHFDNPKPKPNAQQTEPNTESHDQYLETAMTAAIQRHILNNNQNFAYERIVQISAQAYRNAKEEGNLPRAAFNNPGMAKHIEDVLAIKGKSALRSRISVVARPYVASFPSILIIDDRYIFFSLPTDPDALPGTELAYDTVLALEDESGEIPARLRNIVLGFKDESFIIRAVV